MPKSFQIIQRSNLSLDSPALRYFDSQAAESAMAFHSSFPEYRLTPLANMKSLAERIGVKDLYVKDESQRFGLNAFKVLGGSYAIGRYVAQKLRLSPNELSYKKLVSSEVRSALGEITFVTATDGNHGRGVAWTANRLNQRSVVYMPAGSAQERLNNIRALGSDAEITDLNYDDAVRLAQSNAKKNGWVVVQDTSWPGYEEIPRWIMQGYTTMAAEAVLQLKEVRPTHIFLQAGVGAMAGAVAGFLTNVYRENPPVITIVEPAKAACLFKTAKANDGKLHFVTGSMDTIMAGLACGEPCSLGWDVLNACAQNFISVPEYVAAQGMRLLGNPSGSDPRVISGESGAVTVGLVTELMLREEHSSLREQIALNAQSRILCISTEGDTDQANYHRIVWDGTFPYPG